MIPDVATSGTEPFAGIISLDEAANFGRDRR
jgi:hypothetical protein